MRKVLSLAVLGLCAAAHADTFRTFDFNAALDPNTGTGGSVFGTITIDTTAGTYASSSLSSTYGAHTYAVSSSETTQATQNGGLVVLTFGSIGNSSEAFLSLVLPTTGLVNYGGGAVCNDTARCHEDPNSNYSSSYFAPGSSTGDGLTSGALLLQVTPTPTPAPTPVSATPEPSSIALLGSGLAGVAGVIRRRTA